MIQHIPVLLKSSIELLNLKEKKKKKIIVDATFGLGGHSKEILNFLDSSSKLISFDCDDNAIFFSSQIKDERFFFIKSNFSDISINLKKNNVYQVDGFLFDLGLSSFQLSTQRGFSYRNDSLLDMRFDVENNSLTAEKLINNSSLKELADIFFEFGQERKSYRIAESIIYRRNKGEKIKTTDQLVRIIVNSIGKRKNKKHPARKVFQALRIKINNELENLSKALDQAFELLAPEGVIVVISYHSLEDRIVKNKFKSKISEEKSFALLNKKPILASDNEIEINNRARSAKLRAIKKN